MSVDAVSAVLRGNNGKAVEIAGRKGDKGVRAVVARLVLLTLAEHANKNGISWPSTSTIAEETGLSRAAVVRAITLLREQRLIARTRDYKSRRGGNSPTRFVILPKPDCLISEPVTGSVETLTGSEGTSTGSYLNATESDVSHESLEPSESLNRESQVLPDGRYDPADLIADLRKYKAGKRLDEAVAL